MHRVLFPGLLISVACLAQTAPPWVAKSNENAQLLINIEAKYSPEGASHDGLQGFDDKIFVVTPDVRERRRADLRKALMELQSRLAREKDPLVKQDLEILIGAADLEIRTSEANEKYFLPNTDVASPIFFGIQSLLDDQIAPERRQAALIRLKKYTGMESGYTPVTTRQEQWLRETFRKPGLLGPARISVEKQLENTNTYVNGIGLLLEKYKIQGYQEPFAKLKTQLAEYDDFVRKEVLPRSRSDFRLPPEMSAFWRWLAATEAGS